MKRLLFVCLTLLCSHAFAGTPEVAIPEAYIPVIKSADVVEVAGTNDLGGRESFAVHDAKAIGQFVHFLTDDRYVVASKSLKPDFKSLSRYEVRLLSKGVLILKLQVIADSVLDLPKEPNYYMQADRHSDNIMFPLLRLE